MSTLEPLSLLNNSAGGSVKYALWRGNGGGGGGEGGSGDDSGNGSRSEIRSESGGRVGGRTASVVGCNAIVGSSGTDAEVVDSRGSVRGHARRRGSCGRRRGPRGRPPRHAAVERVEGGDGGKGKGGRGGGGGGAGGAGGVKMTNVVNAVDIGRDVYLRIKSGGKGVVEGNGRGEGVGGREGGSGSGGADSGSDAASASIKGGSGRSSAMDSVKSEAIDGGGGGGATGGGTEHQSSSTTEEISESSEDFFDRVRWAILCHTKPWLATQADSFSTEVVEIVLSCLTRAVVNL